MTTTPRPSEIVIMVSGLVAIIFSFLAWFEAPEGFGSDANAWDEGLFPLATYVGIIGLLMGVQVALARFANVDFPARVLGFTWSQIHLALAVFAGLLMIGYVIVDMGGLDKGIGLWISFLAAAGLVVGAVMLHLDAERAPQQPGTPQTPF